MGYHLVVNGKHLYLGKFVGIVVDNNDELKMGRLKVTCPDVLGDPNLTLPWAYPMFPYGVYGGGGVVMVPPIGSMVAIEFLGEGATRPIWVGTFPSSPTLSDSDKMKSPPPEVVGKSTSRESIHDHDVAVETIMSGMKIDRRENVDPKYPYNKVIGSVGSLIEMDDTPNKERFRVEHVKTKTGFQYDSEGNKVEVVTRDGKLYVWRNSEEYCIGSIVKEASGNYKLHIFLDADIKVGGSLTFDASNITFVVGGVTRTLIPSPESL